MFHSAPILRLAPVLLPLVLFIGTGLWGLDFGAHWDERGYQIAPVKRIIASGLPLPGHYGYPSFNYWVSTAALLPEMVQAWAEHAGTRDRLLRYTDSHSYLLRLRAIFLLGSVLSVLWVYLLVLQWRRSVWEAILAALFLALSWEVAYHARWVATDTMLMQFGALTLLLVMLSRLETDKPRWLYVAAVTAGLGFGTKYPGGLLLVPVLVAGYLAWKQRPTGGLLRRLFSLSLIFATVFLLSTPAVILRPSEVMNGVLYELRHYSAGHAGHTVGAGLEHTWRMLVYLSSVLFSRYSPVALLLFTLSIIGVIAVIKENRRTALLLLSFPLLYFIYFSLQRAMVVRNLLVLVPFLAVLSARGTMVLWKRCKPGTTAPSLRLPCVLARSSLIVAISVGFVANAMWLVFAAQSIRDRHTDRFVREAGVHIAGSVDTRFFLSPRVLVHFQQINSALPSNVTSNLLEANYVLLYASEGLPRWWDWPATQPRLTDRWFGPYEVNFNMYPNWWGDDRIIQVSLNKARALGLLPVRYWNENVRLARLPTTGTAPPWKSLTSLPALMTVPPGTGRAVRPPPSWSLPGIEPCSLVSRAQAEDIIGALGEDPRPGGTAMDGAACGYIGAQGVVASIGLISTMAFESRKFEPGNTLIAELGDEAYRVLTNAMGDAQLFARRGSLAIMVNLAAVHNCVSGTWRVRVAEQLSATALLSPATSSP